MADLLQIALDEALAIGRDRAWTMPDAATLAEAQRLLALVADDVRAPQVMVEPDGAITVEWEQAERGWLQLTVHGRGTLTHSAVIDGDEFAQAEAFGPALPDWAQELLNRLRPKGH